MALTARAAVHTKPVSDLERVFTELAALRQAVERMEVAIGRQNGGGPRDGADDRAMEVMFAAVGGPGQWFSVREIRAAANADVVLRAALVNADVIDAIPLGRLLKRFSRAGRVERDMRTRRWRFVSRKSLADLQTG